MSPSAAKVHRSALRGRVKDFLLYCAIGVSLVALGGLYAVHQAKLGQTSGLPVKWLGLAIMTALVFGNAIRYSRHLWALSKFWGFLSVFLIAHLAVGVLFLSRVEKIGLIHFAILTPIEYFALTALLGRFVTVNE